MISSGVALPVAPDVVGLPSSEALSVLADLGLDWVEVVEASDTVVVGE